MPNLNKLRGGKAGRGTAPPAQYGLSQAKYHNSESRLQNPQSRVGGEQCRHLVSLVISSLTLFQPRPTVRRQEGEL